MLWIKSEMDEEKITHNISQNTIVTKTENCTYDGNQSLNNVKQLLTTSDAVSLVSLILAAFCLRVCHSILKIELPLDIQVAQQNMIIHKIA